MIAKVFTSKPPNDPGRLLAEAMWDDCQAHSFNPSDPNFFQQFYFCVWHRYFVYYFEEIVRAVLNDQTFTLPYWDYLSGNVSDLSLPPEFLDENSPLHRSNRNPWVKKGERIDQQNPGILNLKALNERDYIDTPDGGLGFCPILDGNPHGQVHVLVGDPSNMGDVPTAANDPIFWLHHCNIDRLWESWNRLPNHPNPRWPNRAFPFADGQGKAVSVLPVNGDRTGLMKYEYDSYAKPPAPPGPVPTPPTPAVVAAAVAKVTRAFAPEPVTLGTDRVQVKLAPPAVAAAAPASAESVFGLSSPARRLYLTLGGISAPAGAASTYNVFLDLPEGVARPGPDDPHYAGTLHFFGAGGHDQHSPSGHRMTFNVTDTVRGLMAKKASRRRQASR